MIEMAAELVMCAATEEEAMYFQLGAMFEAFLSSRQAPHTVFSKHSFGNLDTPWPTYQLGAADLKCHLSAILIPFKGPLQPQYKSQSGGAMPPRSACTTSTP